MKLDALRNYRCMLLENWDGLNLQEKIYFRKLLMKIETHLTKERTGLTPGQQNAALAIWYVFLTLLIIVIILSIYASAVDLSISLKDVGVSSGHGFHTVGYSGQNITATIMQGNNSTWQIFAEGST
jgi:hypothetical protein